MGREFVRDDSPGADCQHRLRTVRVQLCELPIQGGAFPGVVRFSEKFFCRLSVFCPEAFLLSSAVVLKVKNSLLRLNNLYAFFISILIEKRRYESFGNRR